ncbi:MAG: thioredoxin-disulfide reductase [Calditrichaeota bacterium]|nr:thioredoxin-disulfide reductase [Calditrichota bacterium]
MNQTIRNVIIVGSGPAGLTAAIYAARANLAPLVIEGMQPGGQLMITTDVENYPGFPEGVQGPELMDLFRRQAEKFGTEFISDEVARVDLRQRPFTITLSDGTPLLARTLIIATGATARWLGLESEEKLRGKGVSACATCDGFFFRDKNVVVVGGGDTAMEEGTFLTRFAKKVTLVHRRDALRASKYMQQKLLSNPKVEVKWNSIVSDVLHNGQWQRVTGVRLKNVKTGEEEDFACDGLFLAIGHEPNSKPFRDFLEADEVGYLRVKPGTSLTDIPGVFVAGDVLDKRYRQAVTAAGFGCMAAIDAERFLEAEDAAGAK